MVILSTKICFFFFFSVQCVDLQQPTIPSGNFSVRMTAHARNSPWLTPGFNRCQLGRPDILGHGRVTDLIIDFDQQISHFFKCQFLLVGVRVHSFTCHALICDGFDQINAHHNQQLQSFSVKYPEFWQKLQVRLRKYVSI